MSLQRKVALVTGGAQGIGRALVEALLEEGAAVSVCDWNKEVGEATVEELREKYGNRCIFIHCDVTNDKEFEDCFKATLARYNCLDIVVNNAGTADEKESGWRKVIGLNFVSVVRGTDLGFKYMGRESGGQGGVVVNTASFSALGPAPSLPVYSATKAAVNQYSRSRGSDLYFSKSGVKVIAILPGKTVTPLVEAAENFVVQEPHIIQNFINYLGSFPSQQARNVGRGLVDVLKTGENGSLWLIDDEQPPVLVTPK